jgi:intracellular sulfur oxidation DsrE/DsrF family protein
MHVESGVPLKNIDLAIVVHGGATKDLTHKERYEVDTGVANASAPLIAALLEKNVKVYVCGQSAAFHGVAKDDLLPGVKMALSAMTAHALLDAEGYSLNPF